jgi:O-antigen/teichoic acid export membrane protein
MSSKLQHRLLKGFAAQGFGQAVNLVIQICSVPLYLHYWGKILYGEWVLLSSVLGYLSISDLSFGNAAQNEMTMRVARGDKEGALTVFQSVWLMITVASLTIMLISLTVIFLVPFEVWLHLKQMPHATAVGIVDLLILQVILAQQNGLMTAGFICDGNYALGIMVGNILRLIEFSVGVLVVATHGGLWGLALSVLLMRIVGYLIVYRVLRHRSPWLSFGIKHSRFAILKPLIGPALSFNALPLGWALNLQGVVTVIGIYLGPVAVLLFSTTRTLTRVIWQVLNAIANTVWVELSAAFGAHDLPLARKLHRRACQVALWGALGMTLILMFAGGPLYRVWTHGKLSFDPGLFRLLLVVIICSSLWSTSYVVPMSVNRHGQLALAFLAATSFSLGLAAVLVRFWGIHGAALALVVGELLMILYVMRRSLTLLEDNAAGFLRVLLTPPVGWLWGKLRR